MSAQREPREASAQREREGASAQREMILAVDTSGADAGLVLACDGRVDVALLPVRDGGAARTEDLATLAGALLAAHGCSPREITLLGAVVGPGSYTGLRSGLAFVRGLAFADGIPAVAVGALELLAWRGAEVGEAVIAAWPASSGHAMAAAYRREQCTIAELTAPTIMGDNELAEFLATGRELGQAALVLPPTADSALAATAGEAGLDLRVPASGGLERLAELVAAKRERGQTSSVDNLLPLYLGQSTARPNRDRVAVFATRE